MGNNNGGGSMIMIVLMAACACCVLVCMGSSAAVALNADIRDKLGLTDFWNNTFNGGGSLPLGADGEPLPNEVPPADTSTASDCVSKGNCPNNTGKNWLCPDPWTNDQYFVKFDVDGKNPKCFDKSDAKYDDEGSATPLSLNFARDDTISAQIWKELNAAKRDGLIDGPMYDDWCPKPGRTGEGWIPAIRFNVPKEKWLTKGRMGCILKDKEYHRAPFYNGTSSKHITYASPICVDKKTGKSNPPGNAIRYNLAKPGWKNETGPYGGNNPDGGDCYYIWTTKEFNGGHWCNEAGNSGSECKKAECKMTSNDLRTEWRYMPAKDIENLGRNTYRPPGDWPNCP